MRKGSITALQRAIRASEMQVHACMHSLARVQRCGRVLPDLSSVFKAASSAAAAGRSFRTSAVVRASPLADTLLREMEYENENYTQPEVGNKGFSPDLFQS